MLNYFFDSESIGFYSPTVLIQYAVGDSEPIIHNLFRETVGSTISLIEDMCANNVIGFNLAHDWFHLSRTYGVFQELPKSKPPEILDIHDVENEAVCHDKYCLKPNGSLDLMLYGRIHEFQATMNQKPIRIKRVPRLLAEILIKELEEKIDIPPLYFAKKEGKQNWQIKDLHLDTQKEITPEDLTSLAQGASDIHIDPDFVNLKLNFHPSTGLKPICKYVLNKEIDLIENMIKLPNPDEYSWFPSGGGWLNVADIHIRAWSRDERRIQYAKDDVTLTRDLFKYFGSPYSSIGEYNSSLACMVGALHWKGYEIDKEEAKRQLTIQSKVAADCEAEIAFNSPKKVMAYLKEVCNPIEEVLIEDTKIATLQIIQKNGSDELIRRATLVLDGRHAKMKVNLLNKIIIAGRLYVTFKVTGTKSNRMSGGSMEEGGSSTKTGSINPQGIGKGEMRKAFLLAPPDMSLDNGDFSGYEVAIFQAVSKDENLKKVLLEDKSLHGIWGSIMYEMTYEDVVATDDIAMNEPDGYYARAKSSLFAWFFDAMPFKIGQVLNLPEENVVKGINLFGDEFPGVAIEREKVYEAFSAMSQPEPFGAIYWKEPDEYIESFLGFKRYFKLEFSIIRALYELANNPTEGMKSVGHLIKVKRRDRLQSGSGALQSATFGAAFSLQSAIIRAAMNHKIQSPGGEMNKILQDRIWGLQPKGINKWIVMPYNVHDEIECPVARQAQQKLKQIISDFIEEYKKYVPLLKMEWKQNCKSWGEK